MPTKKKNVASATGDGSNKKKQFPVVAVVTPDGIEGTFVAEPRRPLIAHLPIRSSEVVFYDQPIKYDPLPPPNEIYGQDTSDMPYEELDGGPSITNKDMNAFEKMNDAGDDVADLVQLQAKEQPSVDVKEVTSSVPAYHKKELLVQMKGMKTTHKLPDKVDIACHWCCHPFDGQPAVIPMREEKGVWEVYGCFCCPECALAYLVDESEDSHVKWERISLLHTLYNSNSRIYPAPSRNVLSLFGGHLSIGAFRDTIRDKKVRVDIHMPPMVSILATMDTKPIDFYEATAQKTYVPLNVERVQKAEEGLRLKRSKPLKDKDSTLDSCINLQIRKVTPISFDME